MNILLLRYLMLSFQFNYLSTTILHTIINNSVVILLNQANIKHCTGILTKSLISQCYVIGRFFPWMLVINISLVRYLMLSFQFYYIHVFTTIIHTIINNLVVVLLKSSKY